MTQIDVHYFYETINVVFENSNIIFIQNQVLFHILFTRKTILKYPHFFHIFHQMLMCSNRNWIAMSNNFSFHESCRVNVSFVQFFCIRKHCTFRSKFKSTYGTANLKVRTIRTSHLRSGTLTPWPGNVNVNVNTLTR